MDRSISIRGARTHNLADISLEIPRERLTVVTGVSGSGKSSLVFDTVYAEGQRRYVQSLSTYARLFLERMERPDVDAISEIPPALALRQKNTIKNARSTVGTVTEISDYLRLLFATVGRTVCPQCGGEVSRDTVEGAGAQILAAPGLYVMLAPFEAGSRSIPDAAGYLIQNGYHRLYANDAITETAEFAARAIAAEAQNGAAPPANGTADNTMMVVVDRISVSGGSENENESERVREALEKAFYLGAGRARAVRVERDNGNTHSVGAIDFDRRFNCSRCATAFAEPTTALFSSNSPIGACPECEGFGRTVELDLDKVIPNHESVDAQRADRAVADAGVSRDERVDAEAGAAQKNPHVGAVSRADRRGAHLAARRRRRSARRSGTKTSGRACTASSSGSKDGATRLTSEFCWRSIGGSSPVRHAAAPS